MGDNIKTEADAIGELARKSVQAQVVIVGEHTADAVPGAEVLVLPQHLKAESIKRFLDEYREAPERRSGVAKLVDLDSFIAHAKRFAEPSSALFASPEPTPMLQAVLDYHGAGVDGAPRWGRHRGQYLFPVSAEWAAWTEKSGTAMLQKDFAEFIEDHLPEVLDPAGAGETAKALATAIGCEFASPSKLLELSRGLAIRVDSRARNQVTLQSGETQISYATEHQDESGKPLRVPGAFLIGIPVFRTGATFQIPVRLRYRFREGAVAWFVELYRADRAFDIAFDEACARAATETGLPLFKGTPES